MRDIGNEHDMFAIKVLNENMQQLGWIGNDHLLANHMDNGWELAARIFKITGGKSGKNIGCVVEVMKSGIDGRLKEFEPIEETPDYVSCLVLVVVFIILVFIINSILW